MVEPTNWEFVMSSQKSGKGAVQSRARQVLDENSGKVFTTAELVELLFPAALAKGDGITARKRIFTALLSLADQGAMVAYVRRGEPRLQPRIKRLVKPWLWSSPLPVKPQAPQRYDLDPDGYLVPTPIVGDWVRWEDVKELFQ